MNCKNFRTKTLMHSRQNITIDDIWVVAIDVGYSAVKVFSPNMVACFPSFASKMSKGAYFISEAPANSIMYKDNKTGEVWLVGEVAQDKIANGDTSNSESTLYGRDRYLTEMFKIITRCGIAVGMLSNQYGSPQGKKIMIQTGLPDRYMDDEEQVRYVLCAEHDFSIKLGNSDWINFKNTFTNNDVDVISQPKGTLLSISIDRMGHFIKEARSYLNGSGVIVDPGFGTLDMFFLERGEVDPKRGETYDDLGMKRVLQETAALLKARYGINIQVPNMQKYLAAGKVTYYDRIKDEVKEYPLDDVLYEANRSVAEEAIKRIKTAMKDVTQFNYIVFTGGTSHAWITMLEQAFKYPTLKIVYGNQNDDLGFTFSNVRGYYMNAIYNIRKQKKGES